MHRCVTKLSASPAVILGPHRKGLLSSEVATEIFITNSIQFEKKGKDA